MDSRYNLLDTCTLDGFGLVVEVAADLLEALAALVATNALAGGLWLGMAPPDAVLPVGVLDDVSRVAEAELLEPRGDRTVLLDGRLQLRVHAYDRREARSAARALAAAFEADSAANLIRFTEASVSDLRRTGLELTGLDPDPGPDGRDVWTHVIEFQYGLTESTS
jgi:hypothetical protein